MAVQDDVARLVRLLRWIKQTVDAARSRIPVGNRVPDDPWNEIAAELDLAMAGIEAITTEESTRWRELVAHGLTGRQLAFKEAVVEKLIVWKVWDDILDFVNTLLDSLGLTLVGEYKDAIWKLARDEPMPVAIPQLDP
jgi:hypothetical protein